MKRKGLLFVTIFVLSIFVFCPMALAQGETYDEFVSSLQPISINDVPNDITPLEYGSFAEAYEAINSGNIPQIARPNPFTIREYYAEAYYGGNSIHIGVYANVNDASDEGITAINSVLGWIDLLGITFEQTNYTTSIKNHGLYVDGTLYGLKKYYLVIDTGLYLKSDPISQNFQFFKSDFLN